MRQTPIPVGDEPLRERRLAKTIGQRLPSDVAGPVAIGGMIVCPLLIRGAAAGTLAGPGTAAPAAVS
ncbi:hypothetical protein [Solimonas variicoloris]|uniref:hypothetical protein n=1 Tax=Solimonas variicoloris TaxID=254408 RepID=UPI00039D1FD6|nr:hypothetical protein [Solimonas variicoloris]